MLRPLFHPLPITILGTFMYAAWLVSGLLVDAILPKPENPCTATAVAAALGDNYRCDIRVVNGRMRVLALYEEE